MPQGYLKDGFIYAGVGEGPVYRYNERSFAEYDKDVEAWTKSLSSADKIEANGWNHRAEGMVEYIESKMWSDGMVWYPATDEMYNSVPDNRRTIVAIPVKQPADIPVPDQYAPDHLAVFQHKETGLYHGAYFRNKPTPSGCDRFILHTSTTEGYKTENEAAIAIEKHYPKMEKISIPKADNKESEPADIPGTGKEVPIWYTRDEMYQWLVRNNYSKEIAQELADKWANDLQGAFKKGWEKAKNEGHPDRIDYQYHPAPSPSTIEADQAGGEKGLCIKLFSLDISNENLAFSIFNQTGIIIPLDDAFFTKVKEAGLSFYIINITHSESKQRLDNPIWYMRKFEEFGINFYVSKETMFLNDFRKCTPPLYNRINWSPPTSPSSTSGSIEQRAEAIKKAASDYYNKIIEGWYPEYWPDPDTVTKAFIAGAESRR